MENLGKTSKSFQCPTCKDKGQIKVLNKYDIDYQNETLTFFYNCHVCKQKWFLELNPLNDFIEINRMMLGLDNIVCNHGGGDDD